MVCPNSALSFSLRNPALSDHPVAIRPIGAQRIRTPVCDLMESRLLPLTYSRIHHVRPFAYRETPHFVRLKVSATAHHPNLALVSDLTSRANWAWVFCSQPRCRAVGLEPTSQMRYSHLSYALPNKPSTHRCLFTHCILRFAVTISGFYIKEIWCANSLVGVFLLQYWNGRIRTSIKAVSRDYAFSNTEALPLSYVPMVVLRSHDSPHIHF